MIRPLPTPTAGIFLFVFLCGIYAQAQQSDSIGHRAAHPESAVRPDGADRPGYWSIDINAAQFSIANVHHVNDGSRSLSTPRFTWMINLAAHYNYDFNENVGFYTGAAITNLGVILHSSEVSYKRRIYTLGIPLAVKFGSLKYANFFAGIQVDWALQFQEKHKVNDSVVSKFGEWWSNRTPRVLASWFIGGQLFHTTYFKLQSYFTNFFNRNYTDDTGAQPYSNLIARPFLLTFGFNIITGKKYSFMTHKSPRKTP
jgi:hypothetical protein